MYLVFVLQVMIILVLLMQHYHLVWVTIFLYAFLKDACGLCMCYGLLISHVVLYKLIICQD